MCPNLANGPQLLTHHSKAEVQELAEAEADGDAAEQDAMKTDDGAANGHNKASKFKLPAIVEIALHSFGEDDPTPYLVTLLDDGDVFVYRGFYYSGSAHQPGSKKKKKHALEESLLLRFTKVESQLLFRNLKTNFARGKLTNFMEGACFNVNSFQWPTIRCY